MRLSMSFKKSCWIRRSLIAAKIIFIEQLKKERESLADERKDYVDKLMTFIHKVGELETRLLQLEAPANDNRFRTLDAGTGTEN